MNLIINTSNIVIGGGVQVSKSFIEELKGFPNNTYHIFISPKVSKEIKKKDFPNNFTFYDITVSPSGLISRKKTTNLLDELEKKINPDIVFSVFGPSYWTPKTTHVCGFADGWCYNPDSIAFEKLNFFEKIKYKLLIIYKNFHLKKSSDFLIVETETAKLRIIQHLHINSKKISVVGNTHHTLYKKFLQKPKSNTNNDTFNLFTLSANYKHKNLAIIDTVIDILKQKSDRTYIFNLTIPKKDFNLFKNKSNINNLTPQPVKKCPALYDKYDALFLPTLLETFTASYPEAMVMKRPILTSKLDFAIDVCKDAALYFDPNSPEDIANKIILLSNTPSVYQNLVQKGEERLKDFETAYSRTQKYLSIFNQIINNG